MFVLFLSSQRDKEKTLFVVLSFEGCLCFQESCQKSRLFVVMLDRHDWSNEHGVYKGNLLEMEVKTPTRFFQRLMDDMIKYGRRRKQWESRRVIGEKTCPLCHSNLSYPLVLHLLSTNCVFYCCFLFSQSSRISLYFSSSHSFKSHRLS